MRPLFFTDFFPIRPQYASTQAASLAWILEAHVQAESLVRGEHTASEEMHRFRLKLQEKLWHVGCKPHQIHTRGHIIRDFLHDQWNDMEIYRLKESPTGQHLSHRQEIFQRWAERQFLEYYPHTATPPDELIHVSCTGYVAPSSAQKLIAQRAWGHHTSVLHAYHMGCYGSMPAIRMARGALALGKERVDIVHTEACSLHVNPSLHTTDQLVSQTLFADGSIKYTLQAEAPLSVPCFCFRASHDEILENSHEAMSWIVSSWGFQMSLFKEVPILLLKALPLFFQRLAHQVDMPTSHLLKTAYFAIHPGGPKILTHIQEHFGLSDAQLFHTGHILQNYGNMSSATLPHIWHAMLHDSSILPGSLIVSLAFGPGLSIWSVILEKRS